MKKIFVFSMLALGMSLASQAQTEKKVKPTSTPGQAVHNVFSKHKKHNGYKVKTTTNGVTHKKKVKTDNPQ